MNQPLTVIKNGAHTKGDQKVLQFSMVD